MRTPEFIERCLEAGMPLDMALKAAKAFEAECEIALEQLLEVRRSKERARQAKHRAKKAEGDASHVVSRDITLDDVTKRDLTCERTQVEDTSSSLRSEDTPPEKPSVSTPKGGEKRGCRIPDDYNPDLAVAEAMGATLAEASLEADQFLDYWRSVPGAKGRKLDWDATWRNRCRDVFQRNSMTRKANAQRPHSDDKFDRRQANLARAFAASERVAGQRWEP